MYYTVIKHSVHLRTLEKWGLRLVFSTFPSCSQMPVVFYHSVIHGLGLLYFLTKVTLHHYVNYFCICNMTGTHHPWALNLTSRASVENSGWKVLVSSEMPCSGIKWDFKNYYLVSFGIPKSSDDMKTKIWSESSLAAFLVFTEDSWWDRAAPFSRNVIRIFPV